MSHNYIVTAQKPTAVNACVTGNGVALNLHELRAKKRDAFLFEHNKFH